MSVEKKVKEQTAPEVHNIGKKICNCLFYKICQN